MQQAWHIFKKDVLYLRGAIAIYFGSLMAAWVFARFPFAYDIFIDEWIIMTAGAYLISRLIHADAPAGDRQFWVTRPYRWTSLVAAKVLFILAFIDLPVLLVQWTILMRDDFPFSSVWRGLFFEQFLLLFAIYLPLASLAALTTGLIQFVAGALAGATAGIGIMMLTAHSLRSLEWVRSSLGFLVLLAASSIVLCLQYQWRRTSRNRLVALGILLSGGAAYVLMPWSLAFAVQKRLSTQALEPSSLHVTIDSPSGEKWALAMSRGKRVQISFQVQVQGLPPGAEAKPEALDITLQGVAGRNSRLQPADLVLPRFSVSRTGVLIMTAKSELDRDFFDAQRDHNVTLHGSLYLTIFGNKRGNTIYLRWPNQPLEVTGNLRCFIAPFGVICDSPFRWPNQWISVNGSASNPLSLYYPISYSPFPADLRFYPFERRWAPPAVGGAAHPQPIDARVPDLIVDVAEPVAYLRRDFEISDIHLTDIAVPWRSQRVLRDGKTSFENEY